MEVPQSCGSLDYKSEASLQGPPSGRVKVAP